MHYCKFDMFQKYKDINITILLLIRLHPKYDQAMNNLANILKDQNQLDEARSLLEKAVTIR